MPLNMDKASLTAFLMFFKLILLITTHKASVSRNVLTALVLLVFIGNSGLYAQVIVTDRPDQTEAASTIPKGSFQIESGLLIIHDGGDSERSIFLPTTLFKYAISNTFELRLQHDYNIKEYIAFNDKKSISGIGDVQVGAKLFIYDGGKTQVSFLSHLILPTGNKLFGHGDYATINKLSIGHELSEKVSIGYNLGYDYFNESILTYSVALAFGLTDKVGVYFEPYGTLDESEDYDSNFDMGFTYLVYNNLQLDFSFGFGLNNDMNYTSFGFSWNIPN
jgi:hypothetical protein